MTNEEYMEALFEIQGQKILEELNLNGKRSEVSADDRGVFIILDPVGLEYGDYSFILSNYDLNIRTSDKEEDVYNILKTLIIKKIGEYNPNNEIKEFSKEDYIENKEDIDRDVKRAHEIYSKIYNKEEENKTKRFNSLIYERHGGGKTFIHSVLFKPESIYIANNILKEMNLEYVYEDVDYASLYAFIVSEINQNTNIDKIKEGIRNYLKRY